MVSYGIACGEGYINYPQMDNFNAFPNEDYYASQGMNLYDEYGHRNEEGYMPNVYYPDVSGYDMGNLNMSAMYMNYGMAPAGEMNPNFLYPHDVTYSTALQNNAFYDPSIKDADNCDIPKSGEVEKENNIAGEVSTAATTPSLDRSIFPYQINDGFDIGYSYDLNNTGYHVAENVPAFNMAPEENYHNGGFPYNLNETFNPYEDTEAMINNASIIEIANEIVANVQFLPDKEANGKYSLDRNHPIHCVWRDLNRGHCSWRCRWWENGKRLSKNFNVKRFGEREAMWMAIAMKIRNSTPVERYQLLKEQREAVRNHLELLKQHADGSVMDADYSNGVLMNPPTMSPSPKKKRQSLSSAKRAQRLNWLRIAWTYVKVSERRSGETSVVCRICAKTTKCSRRRNLQQAHIMHLLRMHRNPWKKYLHEEGLTKMCKNALESLYEQHGFTEDSEWKLRPGMIPPEPCVDLESLEERESGDECEGLSP